MNRECGATTRSGRTCRLIPKGTDDYCYFHEPARTAERLRGSSKGGKNRANKETRAVRKLMDQLTAETLSGHLEPKVANAVVALQNIKLRSIEVERKLEESDVREEFESLKRDLGVS